MARRNTKDMLRVQMMSLKKKTHAMKVEGQKPLYKNFDIPFDYDEKDFTIRVEDVLTGKHYKTKPMSIKESRGKKMITSIKCPFCDCEIPLNIHWYCFICNNEDHDKSIFEIQKAFEVTYEDYKEEMV